MLLSIYKHKHLHLSPNFLRFRCFHVTRPLSGDPMSTSSAVILGNFGMMSPAYVLIWALAGYILLNGTIINDLIQNSLSDAQFVLMFPRSRDGPEMFFISDNDIRLMFEYLYNIMNGGAFWGDHLDFIDQLNLAQLRPLAESITDAVDALQGLDEMLESILELDNPMYNGSYEMIVRIRREELHHAIGSMDNIRYYIMNRFLISSYA